MTERSTVMWAVQESLRLRDSQIVHSIARGVSIQETAINLGIDNRTVTRRIRNLSQEMGATSPLQTFIKAVETGLLKLERVFNLTDLFRVGSLSPRQRDVLEVLILDGQHETNEEIANFLARDPATVETHLWQIFDRLKVRSRFQAGLLYYASKHPEPIIESFKSERQPTPPRYDILIVSDVVEVAPAAAKREQLSGTSLTPREGDVLELIAQGEKDREIANLLGISLNTVKIHKEHIFEKLGVKNRYGAVSKAWQLGLLDLSSNGEVLDAAEKRKSGTLDLLIAF